MPEKATPALGVIGHLLNTKNDGSLIFRVYGEKNPETGRLQYLDFDLRVDDLRIQVMSPIADLVKDESGMWLRDHRPALNDGDGPKDRGDHADEATIKGPPVEENGGQGNKAVEPPPVVAQQERDSDGPAEADQSDD